MENDTHVITRFKHAAHTGIGRGWDLERIDVVAPTRNEIADLPPGFEYHSGYRDQERRQHWLYTRKVEFSPGTCERCEGLAS